MGASAQKVTYIHFIHGPLMGNKENDYVAIEMSSKSKDIIFYEAGKKHKRKPQNQYSRYFYTLEKDTIISYSRSSYNVSVKEEKGDVNLWFLFNVPFCSFSGIVFLVRLSAFLQRHFGLTAVVQLQS